MYLKGFPVTNDVSPYVIIYSCVFLIANAVYFAPQFSLILLECTVLDIKLFSLFGLTN